MIKTVSQSTIADILYLFSSKAEGAKISTWQNDEKQTSQ